MFKFKSLFNSTYKKQTTLSGPRDAVRSVSFSVDGSFVSAAGFGGVTIWEVKTSKPVTTPHLPYEPGETKYVFFTSAWLYFGVINSHVFLVGNMTGELSIWSLNDNGQKTFQARGTHTVDDDCTHQVLSIDVLDPSVAPGSLARIVTSTSDKLVTVLTVTSSFEVTTVFKAKLPGDFLPRTVKFALATHNLFAFSKLGGGFLQLQGDDGSLLWVKQNGPKEMHCVSVDEKQDLFASWTGQQAQVFRLTNSEFVGTFQGEISLCRDAKQIAFAEEGTRLVVGTDHGLVEVFEVQSGQRVQTLGYPRKSLVHTVATCTLPNCDLIAIAGSTKNQPSDVVVFKKKCRSPRSSRSMGERGGDIIFNLNLPVTWTGVRWTGYILILLTAAYLTLNQFPHAFVWNVEASVYPFGLGMRFFVYVPLLLKFTSTPGLSSPTLPISTVSPVTTAVTSTTTVTDLITVTATEVYLPTLTVVEEHYSILTVTETFPPTAVTSRKLPATITDVDGKNLQL
ncbi:WD40 repeat-like protein [Dendrothele bispora CBS 962.96]|uniref:WD40 repeat-like protein n=1 Tax=Dendrothele bispora (strain CBS 962.96) TaxID=1314807 RepID=A0A4S8M9I6_DENBC|nr:WD40 repeat-like protein [Dendrothele bispora CBS 962.96]